MSNIPAPFAQIVQNLPGLVPDGRLAVAVSGGPDSMALLWLASRAAMEHGFEIFAYTVDHGLRAESAAGETVQGWIKSGRACGTKSCGGMATSRSANFGRSARGGMT